MVGSVCPHRTNLSHCVLTQWLAVVFNMAMNTQHADAALIESLGGPAAVSRLLGLGEYGTQRVFNWTRRGIPPEVKLDRPDLFLPGWKVPQDARAAEVAALKARLHELERAA